MPNRAPNTKRLMAPYRHNIQAFARDMLGIELHPGQVGYVELVSLRGIDGWRAAYHTICLSSGNRAGKTLVLAIVILHSVLFKTGMRPPERNKKARRLWRQAPYMWFHFAIQQEIAELVYTELVNMLAGMHVAQKGNGCPLTELFPHVADWEKKYNGDYRWIVIDPSLGGGEIHFRTTAEKGVGSLGRDMHGISFDEAGLEKNLTWIVNNVMHLRRLGTGGQLLLVSTPEEGLTEFADFWFMGDPEAPDRHRGRMSIRMSTRDNVGFGIDKDVFAELTEGLDEDHIKQNIDGYFIQGRLAYLNARSVDNSFKIELAEQQPAHNKGVYIQGVDPGLKDRCWSMVFEWHANKLTGVKAEYSGSRTTEAIVALAVNNHSAYEVKRAGVVSQCTTAIDTTALGGHMFRELVQESLPEVISVEFGGNTQVKRKLLGDLKTMLDKGQIEMPRTGIWLKVRRQLLGFKLNDRHIEQDAVMTLACVVKAARRVPDEADMGAPVKFDAYAVDSPLPIRQDDEVGNILTGRTVSVRLRLPGAK